MQRAWMIPRTSPSAVLKHRIGRPETIRRTAAARMAESVSSRETLHLDPVAAQREFYAATAGGYDDTHDFRQHYTGLRHVAAYLHALEVRSVLDTGCGTGLGMRFLTRALPALEVHGNDPSSELLEIASERHGIASERLDCVASDRLPYPDEAFDAVVETGMLHHVPEPGPIVAEMLRVARKVVFISDTNSFGLGRLPARLAKLTLARAGLLERVTRLRRGGHAWYYSEGDGVAWDYSVFDSLPALRSSCREVVVIPTGDPGPLSESFPLLFSSHCLVAGFKQPLAEVISR